MLEFTLISIISLSAFILGLAAAVSAREKSSYYFSLLSFAIAAWVPISYIGNSTLLTEPARVNFTFFDYLIGLHLPLIFYFYSVSIVEINARKRRFRLAVAAVSVAVVDILLFSGHIVRIVIVDGYARTVEEVLFPVYVGVFVMTTVFSLHLLVVSRRSKRSSTKKKLAAIIRAFLYAFPVAVIGSFVVPIFTENRLIRTLGVQLSYGAVVILLFFIWNGVYRYGLFNVRRAATRAVAYVLSGLILLTGFVSIAGLVQYSLFGSSSLSLSQLLLNAVLLLPLVAVYPTVKSYFDRITNSLFYRDAYDAETFLDELNNVLVASIDTEVLLRKSCDLIEQNLKSDFASFFVLNTSYFDNRMVGDFENTIDDHEAAELHELLPGIRKKVIYVQQEPVNTKERRVIALLKKNNVEVLVRIVSSVDYELDGIGYLLLGQKRSGNPYSGQDLRVLEIAGNELELAVENALRFEEIQQFNVTLQNKIDGATKQLVKSNEKLKALDEAKDEFVSMASHQLRTPLTSIKGYVSMVMDGDAGEINEQQKKMLGQALFSSQRMVYLISDLLNVSRLRTGKFVVDRAPTFLPDVVASEMDQIREGASAKNITIVFDKPKRFPTLELDEMKTRQVIMNFVDNAIYYTPTNGTITLSLKNKKSTIEFTVKDTGIGVPKLQQHKLFTKFYRADNARSARPDGTGLGLFMAKKVVIAQGGSIVFSSKENKGSTFGFSFPKTAVKPTKKKP